MANTFNFVVKNGITVGNTPVIASNGTYISAIANTGVQPGVYGNTTLIPIITVGADGRVTAISNTSITSSGAAASITTNVDTFTANGTGQTFVLSAAPYNINSTIINISGVTQQKSSYTLTGSTITLSQILPNGTVIEVSSLYNSANTSNTVPALVPYDDNFTGNGSTTTFTLSVSPPNANYVTVYVSGIAQQKSNYSLSGNVLTFNTAPPNGVSIEVVSIVASSGAFVGLTGTNIIANTVLYYNGSGYSSYSGSTLYANGAIGFSNFVSNISNTQITGLITSSQIANVANTQITGTINSSQLANTAVTAGTYGNYTNIPVITVNPQGQITSATNYAITFPPNTAVYANSGQLTANSSTGNVLLGLATTGTAATYGSSTSIPVFVTDAYGRVISVANTSIGTLNQNTTGSANSATYLTGTYTGSLTSSQITTGLGYTPYNSSNPSGYLTSSGAVTSAVAGTGVSVSSATGAVTFSIGQAVATSSSVQFGSFGVGTAASGTSGEIRATNNITAYYSDDRLKTKLGPITNALDKVKSLNGFYYEANETAQELGYQPIREVGVSAQEVQAILPEIVVPAPISDKYLTVRYEKLIPLLIEAIKEQQEQIEDLLKRIK